MTRFVCPVCGNEFTEINNTFVCKKKHCFDKSKYGYINLLLSQKSSDKRHGDDKTMIKARKDFLDKGYYAPLLEAISQEVCGRLPDKCLIADAGCGEGYYSSGFIDYLQKNGKQAEGYGVDISKDALIYAGKRTPKIKAAVASVYNLPFDDGVFDCVLNIFSPEAYSEYARILKNRGIYVRVVPLERHLYSLKKIIYDEPYLNPEPQMSLNIFDLLNRIDLKYKFKITNNKDIMNLFKMTPYYYKTSAEDQKKISQTDELEVEAEFGIFIYRKDIRNA